MDNQSTKENKKMNINVIELITGIIIVADVEEMDEEPSCFLKNCREVTEKDGEIVLRKWPRYTDETEALIYSDRITTISEPNSELNSLYKKSINS